MSDNIVELDSVIRNIVLTKQVSDVTNQLDSIIRTISLTRTTSDILVEIDTFISDLFHQIVTIGIGSQGEIGSLPTVLDWQQIDKIFRLVTSGEEVKDITMGQYL